MQGEYRPVENVEGGQGRIVQPRLDLDVVKQLGPHGEEVPEQRPERRASRLTRDPPHPHVYTSLGDQINDG